MAHLYRLIALVLLGIVPTLAYAAFPATEAWATVGEGCAGYAQRPNFTACGGEPPTPALPQKYTQLTGGTLYCRQRDDCGGALAGTGWHYDVQDGAATPQKVYSCPANSTLSGSTCTCASGYDQVGSTCVNANEALCAALNGTETYASAPGNVAPGASSCNPTGCTATFAGTVIRVRNSEGAYVTEGAVTFTGGTCEYSAESGVTEDTCPGGTLGEVNGVSTCVPYDPNLNTIETVKDTQTSTTEGGNTTATSSTSSTSCNNGSCTTTTTTNTTVNGGTPTTKTETRSEPQSDFCKNNPTSAQCQKGAFSGACTGGFTCTGDAVQCAMAREQHKRACTLFEGNSDEKTLYNEKRDIAGTNGLGLDEETVNVGPGDFDDAAAFGAGACLAPLSLTVAQSSVTVSFETLCEHMAMFKNVLLLISYLIAIRIVSRG